MNKEEIKKIIYNPQEYDESKEETLRSWLRDAYSKKMRWILINVYVGYLILLPLAIFSGIKFFRTEQTIYQIMYAAIFLFCSQWIGFVSVFGWVMMQRPRISREIKRLELCIAELTETMKNK
jgi:hypothetical protein